MTLVFLLLTGSHAADILQFGVVIGGPGYLDLPVSMVANRRKEYTSCTLVYKRVTISCAFSNRFKVSDH